MRTHKNTWLACLLAVAMLLSLVPMTAFATGDIVVVTSEQELRAAIEAIPQGGSGEITVQGIYIYLNEGLYFENKDITFNLVDAALVTAADEYDYGQPVIFGFGTNITINMDDGSLIQSMGHTGNMGVVRIDNSTDWDEQTETFEKNFTLTVNGGHYISSDIVPEDCEADPTFVAASGTNVLLTNVVCDGAVKEIAFEGVGITVPGELTVNSGRFTNDVREFAAVGKYTCQYGDYYYVREKEMTDDFSKPLIDGKIVFNYAKPSADDEAIWLIPEDFCTANPDFTFGPDGFNDDFSKLELGIYSNTAKEEFHTVDVVWDYDAEVLQTAQSFIEKFPADRPWFNVSDLELINYWTYRNPDSEIDSLANYSGELKEILGNSNFLYNVEVRGGLDDVFYTERIGSAKLIHNGKVYFSTTLIGARAEHAIYVPKNTADTKDALIAAAQKRIDDYIGKNVVKITASAQTVSDYYNSEIANYDEELATAQRELAQAQTTLAAEQAKDQAIWDWNVITQCQLKIMQCESDIEYIPMYKQYFIDQFSEDGDLHFLNNAVGGFFFDLEIVKTGESYKFVIIKDDDKLAVPSYATVDLNTNVAVTTDSPAVPLDTVIEVDKLTEGEEYDRIIAALDAERSVSFDIKLHSGSLDKYVTKLENGRFEVKIPVPEEFKGKALVVYYVDADGKATPHTVTPDGDYATFVTDHFSVYTLVANSVSGGGHGHGYTAEWENDKDNHWHACSCGEKTDVAAHTFKDGKCTVCGAAAASDETTSPETGDAGIPAAAFVLVLIGGALVALTVNGKKEKAVK